MNDQERVTDFLNSEKKMSLNYGIFASECVSVPLRDEFLKLINQSHQTQTRLFTTAQSKGFSPPGPKQEAAALEALERLNAGEVQSHG